MEAILKGHLVTLAGLFERATGTSRTVIGSRAVNTSKFFDRLDDPGTSLTLKTYDRLVGWFSANWPAGLEWPADIRRPS